MFWVETGVVSYDWGEAVEVAFDANLRMSALGLTRILLVIDTLVGNQVVGTAFALDVKFADEIGCGLRGGRCEKRGHAQMCTSVLPKCYLNRRALFVSV